MRCALFGDCKELCETSWLHWRSNLFHVCGAITPFFSLNVAALSSANKVKANKHEARKQWPKRAPFLTDKYEFQGDDKIYLRWLYVLFIIKNDQAEIYTIKLLPLFPRFRLLLLRPFPVLSPSPVFKGWRPNATTSRARLWRTGVVSRGTCHRGSIHRLYSRLALQILRTEGTGAPRLRGHGDVIPTFRPCAAFTMANCADIPISNVVYYCEMPFKAMGS